MDDESNPRWKLLAFLKHLNSLAFLHFASTILYRVILDKLEANGTQLTNEEREERGWEGTTSDSRILRDALKRRHPLKIPQGKFYLVDAGFMIKSGLITPYRGERYHLKEYSRNPPRNHRELFNLRHASLCNSIERAFGVLKKRFPIIASGAEPHYKRETQKLIILTCFILHNFLLDVDLDDEILAQVDRELARARSITPQAPTDPDDDPYDTRLGEMIRDRIAIETWNDYIRA